MDSAKPIFKVYFILPINVYIWTLNHPFIFATYIHITSKQYLSSFKHWKIIVYGLLNSSKVSLFYAHLGILLYMAFICRAESFFFIFHLYILYTYMPTGIHHETNDTIENTLCCDLWLWSWRAMLLFPHWSTLKWRIIAIYIDASLL